MKLYTEGVYEYLNDAETLDTLKQNGYLSNNIGVAQYHSAVNSIINQYDNVVILVSSDFAQVFLGVTTLKSIAGLSTRQSIVFAVASHIACFVLHSIVSKFWMHTVADLQNKKDALLGKQATYSVLLTECSTAFSNTDEGVNISGDIEQITEQIAGIDQKILNYLLLRQCFVGVYVAYNKLSSIFMPHMYRWYKGVETVMESAEMDGYLYKNVLQDNITTARNPISIINDVLDAIYNYKNSDRILLPAVKLRSEMLDMDMDMDMDMDTEFGNVILLVGESGGGKSYMMRHLRMRGIKVDSITFRRSNIHYLDYNLPFSKDTVLESILLSVNYSHNINQALIEDMLCQLGADGITCDRLVKTLSNGEQMQVKFLRGIFSMLNAARIKISADIKDFNELLECIPEQDERKQPLLWYLDEPFNHLNREKQQRVQEMLGQLHSALRGAFSDKAITVLSHHPSDGREKFIKSCRGQGLQFNKCWAMCDGEKGVLDVYNISYNDSDDGITEEIATYIYASDYCTEERELRNVDVCSPEKTEEEYRSCW